MGRSGARPTARRESTDACAAGGLYYVRNLVIHQGADVVWEITRAYGEGAYGTGTYGGPLHLFPPRAQLPSGRSKVGAQEYDDTVSGEEIAVVLCDLAAELGGGTGAQDHDPT